MRHKHSAPKRPQLRVLRGGRGDELHARRARRHEAPPAGEPGHRPGGDAGPPAAA